ncbi:MAG TPA: hypothetical protein VFP84_21170 [Kofleriaceae bacterium]|nr:hypothetical protein [Kofleriaceae bacterium]
MTDAAPGAAPDQPRVPRAARLSGLAKVLAGFAVILIVGYGAMAFAELEPGTPERDEVPASVRSSPGGYRSFHFWHSGYHGGK